MQWNQNLKELKKKSIDAHRVGESHDKPNADLINDKRIMYKKNYKGA